MDTPRRIWWARPRKLCAMERPGGGGRSHRPERRESDIAYLKESGVRLVISTMTTRHNLADYETAGLEWHHRPVHPGEEAEALEELRALLRRELRKRGAIAVHGNRYTEFVAILCAEHLHETRGIAVEAALEDAVAAGLQAVQPRSRIASSTTSGLSVTT